MEENKNKIQIKSVLGQILFEHEKENNTIKDTVEEAVRQNVSLYKANLKGANLYRANLYEANLEGANLNGANLYGASLNRANLNWASLKGASLKGASLERASLYMASLNGASLKGASFYGANLSYANLYGANLYGAFLENANLNGANLYGASLYEANLEGAKDIPFVSFACPSDGAFIGWKKVNRFLVKLEIPEDARRCSATSNKCRCDKAKVLEITSLDNNEKFSEVVNHNYAKTLYKVGEMVYPDAFDENRWNECSNGIHFFINKQEAINYY